MGAVVVIGVGNALRGDDAAGLEVARRLADLDRRGGVTVRAHEGEGLALLDLWAGADAVVLIDTTCSDAPPGEVRRIDATPAAVQLPPPPSSSHAVGVAEAIELGRALGSLPATVIVYGIEGQAFETGSQPSAAVLRAIESAAQSVRREALALAGDGLAPANDPQYAAPEEDR